MLHRWNSVVDGRGERRRVIEMDRAVRPHGLKPGDVARAGDEQTHVQSILRCTLPLGFGLYLVIVVVTIGFGADPFRSFIGAMFVFPFSLLFGVPMGLWVRKVSWRSLAHARDALLAAHICPSCAHGIARIPLQPDGCVVCPECGAAWRMASSGSPS